MNLKLIGLLGAVFLASDNIYSSSYIVTNDGNENVCGVITDNNDNEILFADTDDGPVLIPFSELEKLEVLNVGDKQYTIRVIYKDKSREVVRVDNSLSLMCKNGMGKVELSEVSYVSFIEQLKSQENTEVAQSLEPSVPAPSQEGSLLSVPTGVTTENSQEAQIVQTAPVVEEVASIAPKVIEEEIAQEDVVAETLVEEVQAPAVAEVEQIAENTVATQPYQEVVENNQVEMEPQTQEAPIQENIIEESQAIVDETAVYQNVSPQREEYEVKKYDTLWDLATRFYNDPFQWHTIWENNQYIDNPDLIYPGDKLFIDNIYSDKSSIVYNENIATNSVPIDQRVLYGMKNVSMFDKEHKTVKDTVSGLDEEGQNIYKMIESDEFNKMFSYGFYSKLGEIVDVDFKGDGKVYSRSEDDKVFIKYYSEVRLDIGYNDSSVKIRENDKFVVFDIDKKSNPSYLCKKGEIKVIKVFGDYSVGVVTRYFGKELIRNNDRVYKKEKIIVPRLKKLALERNGIDCRVIGSVKKMGEAITQARDLFIVDAGSLKNVQVGQVFELYTKKKDGYTDLPVGEVYVVKVFGDYSIVQLSPRWKDVKINSGDLLRHKLTFEVYYPEQK